MIEPFQLHDAESRANQKHTAWMKCAIALSRLSTCARRKVGCVILKKSGHIMSTGYNGPAAGEHHCIDAPCAGANYPSGEGLEKCEAVHAEINALTQCSDHLNIGAIYVTAFPCIHCVKAVLNTSCTAIYFAEHYAHNEAQELWRKANRVALLIPNLI